MSKRKTALLAIITLVASIVLLGIGPRRPWSTPSLLHLPDDKHIHQVYGQYQITQRVALPTHSIDGIRFIIDPISEKVLHTPVMLHIRAAGTSQDIRTVRTVLADVYGIEPIPMTLENNFEVEDRPTLYFPFERITGKPGSAFDITLEAGTLEKADAIRIRYQSDGEKYGPGMSFAGSEEKQGNLGFILYERPTVVGRMLRWLLEPGNRLAWVGIACMFLGAYGLHHTIRNRPQASMWWQHRWSRVTSREIIIACIALIGTTFLVYMPALNQFFIHDDVALLARAIHFAQESPLDLVSARAYLEDDVHSRYAIPFWRPLSASLYPWISAYAFSLNAPVIFAFQLILVGITAAALYVLARLLMFGPLAASAAALAWLVHSSKIGVVFWYSSAQDILSSACILAAILAYSYWRAQPRWPAFSIVIACTALAVLSKEHAVLTPFIIFGVCEAFPRRFLIRKAGMSAAVRTMPILGIIGLYLLLRTVAFSDPALPELFHADTTYEFATSVSKVAQNVVTYAAWSAEHWLWPNEPKLLSSLNRVLGDWMWEIKIQPPIYPGIMLLATYTIALALCWRKSYARALLLFGLFWWLIFLGPTLLLNHQWDSRWLYIAIYGYSLPLLYCITRISRRYATVALSVCLVCLAVYGAWQARVPERTRFYREQATYSKEAYTQAIRQAGAYTPGNPVYFVGITPHQTTSVTSYLLRLAGYPAGIQVIRTPVLPPEAKKGDVVIDMTGSDAYYPHYDQD